MPNHRRELQTAVSTSAGLLSALANTGVGRIVLDPGTYFLNAELSVTRSVVIEAAVAGSVVLNANASSSSRRRVLNINPGSLGVVQLIGLNITGGGNSQNVRVAETCEFSIAPMGRLLTCLPLPTLAQLQMLRSSTGGECCRDLKKIPSPRWDA
jgi:hypothetical protein